MEGTAGGDDEELLRRMKEECEKLFVKVLDFNGYKEGQKSLLDEFKAQVEEVKCTADHASENKLPNFDLDRYLKRVNIAEMKLRNGL